MIRNLALALGATAAALAASSTPALADDGAADHDFVTLDRPSARSQLGLSLGKIITDREQIGALNIYYLDLHGQYVVPGGFGGAITAPLVITELGDDVVTSVGNVGATGFYIHRTAKADLLYSAGLALPTATDDDIGWYLFGTAGTRLSDYIATAKGTWLRLAVSPTIESGDVFARADVGVDLPVEGNPFDLDAVVRFNAAVGLDVGEARGQVTAELNNVFVIGADEETDGSYQTFAVSFRYLVSWAEPYWAFVVPYLNEDDGLSFTVTLGVGLVLERPRAAADGA